MMMKKFSLIRFSLMKTLLISALIIAIFGTGSAFANAIPAAPTNLQASGVYSGASLTWTPPADNDIVGYKIYYREESYYYTPTTVVSVGANAYQGTTINGLYLDTSYEFKVTAIDAIGQESPFSAKAYAMTRNW
jgi:fibronectin type 3 domain-containing protein